MADEMRYKDVFLGKYQGIEYYERQPGTEKSYGLGFYFNDRVKGDFSRFTSFPVKNLADLFVQIDTYVRERFATLDAS